MKGSEIMFERIIIQPDEKCGFNFPFILEIPDKINDNPDLVFACNLTRDFSSCSRSYDEVIEKTCSDLGSIDPMHLHLSLNTGNVLFIPCVPRMKGFRPNFFGRDICFDKLDCAYEEARKEENCFSESDIDKYKDLKSQYIKMIQFAMEYLKIKKDIEVDDRIVLSGYSEGAKFVSHFALMHPEIVKTVVAGGTGGCISMPISELNNNELKFPLGTSDIDFNAEAFNKIKFFYYIGKQDLSDPAMPKFNLIHYIDDTGNDQIVRDECGNATPYFREYGETGKVIYIEFINEEGKKNFIPKIIQNSDLHKYLFYKNEKGENTPLFDEKGNQVKQMFILDENGNYLSYYSLYNDYDVNIINKELGLRTQTRFDKQEEIYKKANIDCVFISYEGNHRTIFDFRDEIFKDVDSFIQENNVIKKI